MEKQVGLSKGENKIELTLDMGNRMQTWSEFHPTLYALNVTLATNEGKDNIITDFGMRDFCHRRYSVHHKRLQDLLGAANTTLAYSHLPDMRRWM